MNIFELLGLPANHRKDNKVTQLVKHYDEVIEKHKKDKRLAVQLKKDGVCALTVIRDGMASIWSRTGKKFTNTSQLSWAITKMNLPDGVYFGEMTSPHCSLEVLSGVTNPNRVKPLTEDNQKVVALSLEMNFFDLISLESFIEGASQTKYHVRFNHLCERVIMGQDNFKNDKVCVLPYVHITGGEEEIDYRLERLIEQGEEGLVIIDLDADWEAGHKGWRKMKKVRYVDYDLKCIGYEEGTGKCKGLVVNLLFNWKGGKTIKPSLGKGWTHQMAKDMFEAIKSVHNSSYPPSSIRKRHIENICPIGKIFQVYALQESSKGKLRIAKVGEQRHDKDKADI